MKPETSAKGISSQSNGAQQLPGSPEKRPFPDYVGKNASHVTSPLLGAKGGGDAMKGSAGRKGK